MKCLKCVPGSGKFQGHMGTHTTAAQSNRGKLFVADAATPYKTSSKDRKDRSDKIQKTKETRNVIICDTCENEYLLEDISQAYEYVIAGQKTGSVLITI
jgi:predicted  nucleic acid-binding Zn-ribbon protein